MHVKLHVLEKCKGQLCKPELAPALLVRARYRYCSKVCMNAPCITGFNFQLMGQGTEVATQCNFHMEW